MVGERVMITPTSSERHGVIPGVTFTNVAEQRGTQVAIRHQSEGRHLRNVAEQQVRLGIHRLNLGPLSGEAELTRLVEKVRVLTSRDLVLVHVGRGRELARLERHVQVGANLPQGEGGGAPS